MTLRLGYRPPLDFTSVFAVLDDSDIAAERRGEWHEDGTLERGA